MTRCDVCNSTKMVRLPVLQSPNFEGIPAEMRSYPAYKDFPCPQCGDVAPYRKILCIKTMEPMMHGPEDDSPETIEHIRDCAAHSLVDFAFKHELVSFKTTGRGEWQGDEIKETRATLCVVAPVDGDRMETEIQRRSAVAAEKMLLDAAKGIIGEVKWAVGDDALQKFKVLETIYREIDAARARWQKTEGKT